MPDEITFRALTRADLPMLWEWLGRPHVAEWWGDPPGPGELEEKYGPRIDDRHPTRVFVIRLAGRDAGFVQATHLHGRPEVHHLLGLDEAVEVDLFLAEPDDRGRGFGPRVLAEFVATVVARRWPGPVPVVAGVDPHNARSRGAFRRAGFVEHACVLAAGDEDREILFLRAPA